MKHLLLLAFMLACGLLNAQNYSGGSGTISDPYLIGNKTDLKYLSENSSQWNNYFKQTTDIHFTAADFVNGGDFYNAGKGFRPIGNLSTIFSGSYNGDRHTIDSLFINDNVAWVGFFGGTGGNASIADLSITNCKVSSNNMVGGLIGLHMGTVARCHVSGRVSGGSNLGLLIGSVQGGAVADCYSEGNVAGDYHVGGLIGEVAIGASVINCYSTSLVTATSTAYNIKGGLIGYDAGSTVYNSFWDMQTSGLTTSAWGTGKTTSEMKMRSTFTSAGWDLQGETANGTDDIWKMESCTKWYPVFSWQNVDSPIFTSNIVYVDSSAAGTNTGLTWQDALTSLGEAFAIAKCGGVDSILVAKGTYIPDRRMDNPYNITPGELENSFVLVPDVKVIGGYPTGGGARNPQNFLTILSGDYTSGHVVVSAGNVGTAELNGFTLSEGGSSSPTNTFVNGYQVYECSGGGMYASVSSPTLKSIIFRNNTVGESGGGYFGYQSSPTMESVSFLNNSARNGGGMANQDKSSPIVTGAQFMNNFANSNGGAIFNIDTCAMVMNNAYVIGNVSYNGGAIANEDLSTPIFTNVQITGNKAEFGGGIYNNNFTETSLMNVTIAGNWSSANGSGVYNIVNSSTAGTNCIVFGNELDDVYAQAGSQATFAHSLVEGIALNTNGNIDATNISVASIFVSPLDASLAPNDVALNETGDYRLKAGSPALNSGTNIGAPAKDIERQNRPFSGVTDMGAHESITCILTAAGAVTSNYNGQNISCRGASDGQLTATPSSGVAPYSYLWNNTATTATISVAAGTYSCVITDADGCTASTGNITVTQPAAALAVSKTVTHVLCRGNSTGAINITATGGTGAYSYSWGGGITTEDRASLPAGTTYNCTVTDANGCTASTGNIAVTQPASVLAVIKTATDVLCHGSSTGAIDIMPYGGTTPYTYNWGGGITTEDRSSLPAGTTYNCTVTDANGCTVSTGNITVTQPTTALAVSKTVTHVLCRGNSTGAINITATGGTGAYSYDWGGGITTEDRASLPAGTTYNCTVTDANGCTASTGNIAVMQPASVLAVIKTATDILCHGNSTGAIDIMPYGGTTPYTYNWGGGITTEDRSSLPAGTTYNCTVTDANGCTVSTGNITVTQPAAALTATTSQVNVVCNGNTDGSATVSPAGGTVPYAYSWSPDGGNAATANNLTSYTYTVTITDANNCELVKNVTIDAVDNISPVTPTLADINAQCAITVTAPTTIDNCSGTITGTTTDNLTHNAQGSYIIHWVFTDGAGNFTTADQNVIIDDITAPAGDLATLEDVTSECEVTSLTSPTATDNCSAITVTNDATFPITAQGTTVVTWTYTDANGNSSTQTQNIVIDDITAPAGDLATLENVTSECEVTSLTAPTATDNCSAVSVTNDATFPIKAQGTTVVTWTYADANGNSSTQAQNVIIQAIDVTTETSQVTITANNASAVTYQWIDCNNANQAISGETHQSFTASENGSYAVVISNGQCADTSDCVVINSVGMDEHKLTEVNVFPNPTAGEFTIVLEGINDATINLFDAGGKLLQEFVHASDQEKLDISHMASGVYLIQVKTENGIYNQRLIKE